MAPDGLQNQQQLHCRVEASVKGSGCQHAGTGPKKGPKATTALTATHAACPQCSRPSSWKLLKAPRLQQNFKSAVSLSPAASPGLSGGGLFHLQAPLLPVDECQLVSVPTLCLRALGLGCCLQGVQGGGLPLPICSRSLGHWRLLLWGAGMLWRLCKLVPAGTAGTFKVAVALRCLPYHPCTLWAGSDASTAYTHYFPCSNRHHHGGASTHHAWQQCQQRQLTRWHLVQQRSRRALR